MKTYAEINARLKEGRAVVLTAEEAVAMVREKGARAVAEKVDVVTTATFGPMCSSGAFFNFGHADPPIRMSRVWLNDVPAHAGVAAVDAYLGVTELSETRGMEYGGAHVIEDLVAGRKVRLRATSYGTDCYPRREIDTMIDLEHINQAYMFNPRNAYQNYPAAVNGSGRVIYTYMGTLLPHLGNVNYSTAGELSPLLKDPYYRTIGIGTRIFLGGTTGYVAWEGTQHNPGQQRADNGIPVSGAGTLALIGDLKGMDRRYLRAAVFDRYGVTMYVGVGIPIPILDEDMARSVGVGNDQIRTTIVDYGVPRRARPSFGQVTYAELRSGQVAIAGRKVPTAPLSSLAKAREIASVLKNWLQDGRFLLQEPVQPLPMANRPQVLADEGEEQA